MQAVYYLLIVQQTNKQTNKRHSLHNKVAGVALERQTRVMVQQHC
jgi:hypothetical protein